MAVIIWRFDNPQTINLDPISKLPITNFCGILGVKLI